MGIRLGSVGNEDLIATQSKLTALRTGRDLSKVLTPREQRVAQTEEGRRELVEELTDTEEYFRTKPNM